MKIAFIVDQFPVLSETFILNQIIGLLNLKHTVDIFARSQPNTCEVHKDVMEYNLLKRTHYLDSMLDERSVLDMFFLLGKQFFKDPVEFLEAVDGLGMRELLLLVRAALTFKDARPAYDIIHCHFGPNGRFGVRLRELGVRGKLLVTFHGYDVSSYVRRHGDHIYEYVFRKVDLFTVNSEFVRGKVVNLGCDPAKIIKLPVGIPLERFDFQPRRLKAKEPVKILTIARLKEKKGLEYSIRAVSQVLQDYPNLEYRIVGDGPLKSKLAYLISELSITDKVRLLGWKDQSEIIKLYDESHIFLLTSVTARNGDHEGQGLVLQEAQAKGLPVVSTLHNGIPEGVLDGESGFLVPERDTKAIAEKLRYLIENPQIWPRMGLAGREFVERHYGIKRLNRRLVEIYEALLAGSSVSQV